MARYSDDEAGEYYIEEIGEWKSDQLGSIIWGNDLEVDPVAQALFVEAFFENDSKAYQALVDHMWDEYEIDFEDAFDWEDFRAWYDAA